MFEGGAHDLGVDLLRLTREQLRFGGDHIGARRDAKFISALSDLQRQRLGDDRVVQQLFQLILGAQLKVIGRQFGLRGQPCRGERRRIGLGGRDIALRGAPDAAPDVDVPVGRDARRISILR